MEDESRDPLKQQAALKREYTLQIKEYAAQVAMLMGIISDDRAENEVFLKKMLRFSLLGNLCLIALLVFTANPRTETLVAQQRLDGGLALVATSEKPYYDLQDIKDFAEKRARNVHTWTYQNYIQTFEDERPYWDADALGAYTDSLIEGGVFKKAKSYRRRYESTVPRRANVKQQIKYKGEYRIYRVHLKLNEEAIDIEGVSDRTWAITIDVREVPPEEGWAGLKVMRYDEVLTQ